MTMNKLRETVFQLKSFPVDVAFSIHTTVSDEH